MFNSKFIKYYILFLFLSICCIAQNTEIIGGGIYVSPSGGGGSISVVQEASNSAPSTGCTAGTTCTVSLTGVGAGHSLIYVCMSNSGATGTMNAATDNNSNTISLVKLNDSAGGVARIDWVSSANSGNTTMTCNVTAAGSRMIAHIWEVVLVSKAVDQTNNGTQAGTAQSISTSGSTSAANELVMGVFYDDPNSDTLTAGSGFSPSLFSTTGAGNESGLSEVKIVSSAGVQTATATCASGTNSIRQIIATFK